MSIIKASLSILLPGATMLQEKDCQSDPKNKYDTNFITLLVHSKKGKNSTTKKETIKVNTRKTIPAKQVININEEAYNYMTSTSYYIKGYKEHQWKSLSKKARLEAHFNQIAEHLGGVLDSYEIFD